MKMNKVYTMTGYILETHTSKNKKEKEKHTLTNNVVWGIPYWVHGHHLDQTCTHV